GCVEVDPSSGKLTWEEPNATQREDHPPPEIEILTRALVTGIREFFSRTGFEQAFLGLSGGIDSALVAVLLAQALGPEKVHAITMPSQYSSAHSLRDAEELARRLKIQFSVLPIKFAFSVLSQQLAASQGGL